MLLSLYFYVLKAGSSITNLEQFLTVLFNICMKEKKKKNFWKFVYNLHLSFFIWQ